MVLNTQFRKQDKFLFTNVHPGTDKTTKELSHATHFQVDYGVVEGKWMNSVLNAEADPVAALQTFHNPVMFKIQVRLIGDGKKSCQTHCLCLTARNRK